MTSRPIPAELAKIFKNFHRIRNLDKKCSNKHYLRIIFRCSVVAKLSTQKTWIYYGPPSNVNEKTTTKLKTEPDLLKTDSSSSSQQRQQAVVKEEHPSAVVAGEREATVSESNQNIASSSTSSTTLPLTDDSSAPTTSSATTTNLDMHHTNAPTSSSTNDRIQSMLVAKKIIINRCFNELSHAYNQLHNHQQQQQQRVDRTKLSSQSVLLGKLRHSIAKITAYTGIRSITSFNYNKGSHSSTSYAVRSVEFNKSYERFAIVGPNNFIKIYDYANILDRPYAAHYPLSELKHDTTMTCLSWNRYFSSKFVCSDFNGVVTLWDVENSTFKRSFKGHKKCCWSVQFCDTDPRMFASASEDSQVKIWSINSKHFFYLDRVVVSYRYI